MGDQVPNLRGPSLLAKLVAGVVGWIIGALPLAVVATVLERAGRPTGIGYSALGFGCGLTGAIVAIRRLTRPKADAAPGKTRD